MHDDHPPHDPLIGTRLGDYTLESVAGRQPFAVLYHARRAEDEHPDDDGVIVRVFPHDLLVSETAAERFAGEATLVARLEHAAIYPLVDSGIDDGWPYLVRPNAPGGALADQLELGQPLPLEDVVAIVRRAALALDAAHTQGVAHGGLCPEVLLYSALDEICLADFNLPVVWEAAPEVLAEMNDTLAPEVVRGEAGLVPSVDVYALGMLAFRLLTGQQPFQPNLSIQQMMLHVPSLRAMNSDVPVAVDAVVRKALSKQPSARYQRAGGLARALARAAAQPESDLSSVNADPGHTAIVRHPPLPDDVAPPPGGNGNNGGNGDDPPPDEPHDEPVDHRPRIAGRSRRWYAGLLSIVLLIAGWFTAGAILGTQIRRASVGAAGVDLTPPIGGPAAEATATQNALIDAAAAATQQAAIDSGAITRTPRPSPSPDPTMTPTAFAGSRGRVAFVSERDGDPEIYVIDLETGTETRITDNNTIDGAPAWSPDGRWLAFHSNNTDGGRHIFIVDTNCLTRGPSACVEANTELTDGLRVDAYPVWSPDSHRLAFASNEGSRWYFRTITLEGEETTLSQMPEEMHLFDWSPEGVLTFYGPTISGEFEVQQLPLTGLSTDREAITNSRGGIQSIAYSPDRETIVYAQRAAGPSQLYLARADCAPLEDCTIQRLTGDSYNYLTPQFSPDGSLVLTTSNRDGVYDLYILNLRGEVVQRVTGESTSESNAVWQP
jgi:Tol biopolymer transport system component/serine/threonine protein kinase